MLRPEVVNGWMLEAGCGVSHRPTGIRLEFHGERDVTLAGSECGNF